MLTRVVGVVCSEHLSEMAHVNRNVQQNNQHFRGFIV
jgi:hypothetical protein